MKRSGFEGSGLKEEDLKGRGFSRATRSQKDPVLAPDVVINQDKEDE